MNQSKRDPILKKEWLEEFTSRMEERGLSEGEIYNLSYEWVTAILRYYMWLTREGFSTEPAKVIIYKTVDRCDFDLSRWPRIPSCIDARPTLEKLSK